MRLTLTFAFKHFARGKSGKKAIAVPMPGLRLFLIFWSRECWYGLCQRDCGYDDKAEQISHFYIAGQCLDLGFDKLGVAHIFPAPPLSMGVFIEAFKHS